MCSLKVQFSAEPIQTVALRDKLASKARWKACRFIVMYGCINNLTAQQLKIECQVGIVRTSIYTVCRLNISSFVLVIQIQNLFNLTQIKCDDLNNFLSAFLLCCYSLSFQNSEDFGTQLHPFIPSTISNEPTDLKRASE